MTRRSTLVSLAVVAAIAVAVPAIAQVDATYRGADFKKIGNQLRKLAHKANKKANKALKLARQAQGPGGGVTAPGSSTAFSHVGGAVTTDSENQYVQLGGPVVIVNVPASGTVQVAAQAFIDVDAGAVALFQDGALMPGQSDFCEVTLSGTPGPPLFASPDGLAGTWSTPATPNGAFSCANSGPASPVTFQTTPGQHTYELRYAYCGCTPGNSATFSNRNLWVTGLP